MKHTPATREEIMELVFAFRTSRILLTACKLDLFTLLEGNEVAAAELAGKAGIDGRAAEILLDALAALGFLVKREARYTNAEVASRFLVKGRPDYIAGLAHQDHLWESWSKLTDVVRTGRPSREDTMAGREKEWLEAFIAAMHDRGEVQARQVAAMLELSGVRRLLDVGGGSGIFAATFAEAAEGLEAVVFDLPEVVPLTRRYLDTHPAGDRVQTKAGDYMHDDLGTGFDLILLSAIVHSNSPLENELLLGKCAQALLPGGRICIVDYVTNAEHTEPVSAALFSVNMLVNTRGGRSYSLTEMRSWLEKAGFTGIEHRPMSRGLAVVTGRKSAG